MSVHSLPNLVNDEKQSRTRDQEPKWKTLLRQEKRDLLGLSLWRGAFGEFVGTGLLCTFTIGFGMTPEGGVPPSILQIAIAVGFFIGVIITTFANASGGHVNPGISLAFFVTGHCTLVRFLFYSLFQVLGGVTGTGLLRLMAPSGHVGSLGLIQPGPDITDEQAVLAEAVITFLLIFATVAMIDPGRTDVQGSVPLMVGLTVSVNIFFSHSISGGCMNPARATGPAVVTGKWDRLWIYWLGPMAGALIGAVLYDVIFSARKLTSKRWCSPQNYASLGEDRDDDDDDENNNGDGITSDAVPLRSSNNHRAEDFESGI